MKKNSEQAKTREKVLLSVHPRLVLSRRFNGEIASLRHLKRNVEESSSFH